MKPKRPEQAESQLRLDAKRLETFLDMRHPLIAVGNRMDWGYFEQALSEEFSARGGPKASPVRLIVGLMFLKHSENLSDEALIEKWVENPYWQYFCGFEYFQHKPPCDPTMMTRWRKRMGEEVVKRMLQETLRMAMDEKLVKPAQLKQVVVDTTVQEKAITFPTDAKLLFTAREKLVEQAEADELTLRQTYRRVGKNALYKSSRYAHAKQYKRHRRVIKKMRTQLGRVIRDISRKAAKSGQPMTEKMLRLLGLAKRVHEQTHSREAKNKVYSLHEPDVACIAKGKAHKPYEFGSKVSIASTIRGAWIVSVKSFGGNPYDGSTLKEVVQDIEGITNIPVQTAFVDKGYRGTVHWPEHVDVIVSGRKRLSPTMKRLLNRRQAIEPIIGHLKHDHRLDRNFLKGKLGDALNAMLAGAAFNFRKICAYFRRLFVLFLVSLAAVLAPPRFARPE
jgi:transposase, IS5 family